MNLFERKVVESVIGGLSPAAKSEIVMRLLADESMSAALEKHKAAALSALVRGEIDALLGRLQEPIRAAIERQTAESIRRAVVDHLAASGTDLDPYVRDGAKDALMTRAHQTVDLIDADIRRDFPSRIWALVEALVEERLAQQNEKLQAQIVSSVDAAVLRDVSVTVGSREQQIDSRLDSQIRAKVEESFRRAIARDGEAAWIMSVLDEHIGPLASAVMAELVPPRVEAKLDAADIAAVVQGHLATRLREPDMEARQRDVIEEMLRPLVGPHVRDLLASKPERVDRYGVEGAIEYARSAIAPTELRRLLAEAVERVVREDRTSPRTRRVPDRSPYKHRQYDAIKKAVLQAKSPNVLLVGPAGCGKTFIAEQLAAELGAPFEFNGPIQSEYKLTGFIDAAGSYHDTPFRRAFEDGGVYLFDELDACSAQALVTFNTALSSGQFDFPDQTISKSSHFYCIAAANTFGRGANHIYVGRNALDAATVDRFVVFELDFDPDLERTLATRPGTGWTEAGPWVATVQKYRDRLADQRGPNGDQVRHVISMRASIEGAKLLNAGFSTDEVENMVIWRGLDPNMVAKIKRS